MSDRRVRVLLDLVASGFQAGVRAAKQSTDDLIGSLEKNQKALGDVSTAMMGAGAAALAGVGVVAKTAMDWESAWAGVKKTVDGTDEQLRNLEGSLREMARTMPATHTEIAAVAEAAGQLGVATDDVASFTRTMIMLGETTNLTADEAATSIAQISNIMGTAAGDVDRFAATLVKLGNNGASTEDEILNLANRIAGAANIVGMSEKNVLALSNAMASVGINAELGGSAMSRAMIGMNTAVLDGGKKLDAFAKIANMSAKDFSAAWKGDPVVAMQAFVAGLGRINDEGGNTAQALADVGLKGTQNTQVFLALAGASDVLSESVAMAASEWDSAGAHLDEYGNRLATTESQVTIAWNNIKDAAITAGEVTLPVVAGISQDVAGMATAFGNLPAPVQEAGIALAGVAGSVLLVGGGMMKATVSIAETVTSFRNLTTGIGGASLALGGVTAVLAIAGAAYMTHAAEQAKATAAASEFTGALRGQSEAVNESSRAVAAKQLQEAGAFDAARKLGISVATLTEASLGNAEAQRLVETATRDKVRAMSDEVQAAGKTAEGAGKQAAAYRETLAAASVLTDAVGGTSEAFNTGVQKARELEEATGGVAAKQVQAVAEFRKAAEAADVTAAGAAALAVQYGLIPTDVATAITAPGSELSKEQVIALAGVLWKVPSLTEAKVLAPGARPSKAEVDEFVESVGDVPGMTTAQIRTIADLYGVEVAKREIASVQGKTVRVAVQYTASGNASYQGPGGITKADGGILHPTTAGLVEAFQHGGVYQGSFGAAQPQIRPAGGAGVLWAEEGAGPWEAFISGHPGKRRRSRWLLEEVASRLGGQVSWATAYADGGIRYAPNYSPPPYASSARQAAQPVMVQMPSVMELRDVDGALIGRMRVEARGAVHESISTGRGRR